MLCTLACPLCKSHAMRVVSTRVLPLPAPAKTRADCGGQVAAEVLHRQRAEFHADGEAPLQFRHQVGRLGQMERTRRDEQDMVGLDHTVARVDGRAFHQRQQVALHALTGNITALHATAHGNLVDLVQEDDAVLLDVGERGKLDLLVVDQLAGLFVHQQLHGFGNAHLALARLAGHPLHHALQLGTVEHRHHGGLDHIV